MILEELTLYADYFLCRGLCCRAFYFSKLDDFPQGKPYDVPYSYLCSDHTCKICHELRQRGMKGCLGYDCLNTEQFTVQRNASADQDMFAVYRKLFSLHQILQYLGEALLQKETASLHGELQVLARILDTVCRQPWRKVLTTDIGSLHEQTNCLLRKTMQQKQFRHPYPHKHLIGRRLINKRLRGTDFGMKSLLAVGLSGCNLQGSCLLGSDTWDCRITGGDLRNCLLLTQMQLNAVIGDSLTRLPNHLHIPAHWNTVS